VEAIQSVNQDGSFGFKTVNTICGLDVKHTLKFKRYIDTVKLTFEHFDLSLSGHFSQLASLPLVLRLGCTCESCRHD
jgi:hypothetical protein